MEDNKQNPEASINIQAEKIILSGLIEANQGIENKNIDRGPAAVQAEALKPEFITVTEPPIVNAQKTETNPNAAINVESNSFDKKIQKETNSIRNDISETIVPMIENLSSSVSNNLRGRDGDKLLETRVNQAETNPVFIQRLDTVMANPVWA